LINIPAPDERGIVDMTAATVVNEVVGEVLDTSVSSDNVIDLDASNPFLKTVTRAGLVYMLREGVRLDAMRDGDSTVGDGLPWIPTITVKGGNSGFYSIEVRVRGSE
jgi:hypothetical protein